jgi:peptide/nickel transport system substrate-binding protein
MRTVTALTVAGGVLDLGLAGCGSSSTGATSSATSSKSATGQPKTGGTAQVAAGDASSSENLDPQRPWNQNNGIYVQLAWETLVLADSAYNLSPVLATSWSSDSSLKEWTFKLRTGVKFHDGSPLTAQDVVWSIRRILQPSLASPLLGPLGAVLDASNVKAMDAHTVVAKLSHPDAYFPVIFSSTGSEIVKAGQDKFPLSQAYGTGPFRFTSFEAGQGWAVVRNTNYWQPGLPYLDGVRGVSIPDPTALVQAVTSGASDLTTSIAFSQIPVVQSGGAAKVLTAPAFFDNYIIMNARHKPFDDVRVRQAVKLADNRHEILKTAYQGNGVLTTDTPCPSTDQLYPAALGVRPQEIAQAKALLAQAGFPHGLDLTLYTSDLLGGMVDEAVALSQAVAPAGIRISIKQHPAATYFEQIWLHEGFYTSWVPRAHPAIRVAQAYTSNAGWPETQIPHTQTDALLASAISTSDPGEQKARMGTLLTWMANNDGYLSACFEDLAVASKTQLHGVEFPLGKGGAALRSAWLA